MKTRKRIKKGRNSSTISIRIPNSLRENLEQRADKMGISLNAYFLWLATRKHTKDENPKFLPLPW